MVGAWGRRLGGCLSGAWCDPRLGVLELGLVLFGSVVVVGWAVRQQALPVAVLGRAAGMQERACQD